MTTVKRSLSAILNKLCSVEYIGQKNPSNGQFYLAKNGLKLKKNIVESMSLGRMDLEIVSNEKSAMEQLKKGICAISLGSFSNSKPNQDIVFQNSEGNDKGKTIRKTKNLVHSWEIIKDVSNEAFAYQEYSRRRRTFWKNFMFNQDHLVTKELENSGALITANLKDLQNVDLNKDLNGELKEDLNEDLKEQELKDNPENADQVDVIELESLEMLPSENFDLENKDWKIFHSTIDPNAGTMAVLMDASLRYRQFDEFSSRLSLPMKIAPMPLGLLIDEKSYSSDETSQSLQDLAQYVEYLLSSENIEILKQNDYQTFDDLGVPYVIVIDESSLDKGVIKIRDRETNWNEQIHLAHIAQRMVKTFQDRDIPDVYSLVKEKYRLP